MQRAQLCPLPSLDPHLVPALRGSVRLGRQQLGVDLHGLLPATRRLSRRRAVRRRPLTEQQVIRARFTIWRSESPAPPCLVPTTGQAAHPALAGLM